jgi:putative hydrolase of the HAD superfamily
VIFFDAAGTLFEVRGSVGRIYSQVASRHGVTADPEELDRSFYRAFQAKSDEGLPAGPPGELEAEKAWWREVVRQAFGAQMPPDVFPGYFDEVFEVFRTARAWRLYRDTEASLKLLRSCGYRLGVISNFDSRLYDVLANLDIRPYFEQVILSWQVRSAKPDEQIFRFALHAMGVPASRALHVGDSLEEDVQGAAQAGLRAVLLDRKRKRRQWKDGPRIESLEELCALCGCSSPLNGSAS